MNELDDYSLAKAYGQAMFELALEAGSAEALCDELDFISEVLHAEQELGYFLHTPFISSREKIQVITSIFKEKISDMTLDFLCVLSKNARFGTFEPIRQYYRKKLDEHHGLVHAELIVDRQMDEQAIEKVKQKLEHTIGKKVKVEMIVDPSILGGVIINCRGKVIDNSVRGALRRAVSHIKGIR